MLEAKLHFDNRKKRKLEREFAGHTDLNFVHYNLDVSYSMYHKRSDIRVSMEKMFSVATFPQRSKEDQSKSQSQFKF